MEASNIIFKFQANLFMHESKDSQIITRNTKYGSCIAHRPAVT
jgi:hypothetical protein